MYLKPHIRNITVVYIHKGVDKSCSTDTSYSNIDQPEYESKLAEKYK